MNREDDILRASEIAEYLFCARAWWLGRVKGLPSQNVREMKHGVSWHQRHGRAVERFYLLQRLAVALLILAIAILAVWMWRTLGG